MRVTHLVEGQESRRWVRETAEIPPGSYAVIFDAGIDLDNKTDRSIGDDQGAFLYSDSTDWTIYAFDDDRCLVQTSVHQLLLRRQEFRSRKYDGEIGYEQRHIMLWSERPFVVIVRHDDARMVSWAHMATRVNEHGLTRQLPDFHQPHFASSKAIAGMVGRPGKWCRLTDLARLTDLNANQILQEYWDSVRDFASNMHYLLADSPEELATLTQVQTAYGIKWLEKVDVDRVWVRKHFALVVLYFHHVGYPKRFQRMVA